MISALLKRFLTLFLILLPFLVFAQKQKWPHTLLWRISGNGLAKPSYLYGTMHLQDKKLFNFGDSTYAAIEATEGLALEVNFNEIMDSMLSRMVQKKAEGALTKQMVTIDKKNLSKSSKLLLNTLGIKGDKLTQDQLKGIRDYRIKKLYADKQMPTIVDGYLYGMANRMGKWLGGIEDPADQLNALNEIGSSLSPDEVFTSDDQLKYSMDKMSGIYQDQDLQSISDISYGKNTASYTDIVLIKRNIKMAARMDSLAHIRSMFFAVGAAHLPGDSGVISFLRDKGFQVEPVFASKKIPAEQYTKKLAALPWTTVTDENKMYAVEMPGTPFDFKAYGEAMKMKMFFDLSKMTYYMSTNVIGGYKSVKDMREALDKIAENSGGPGTRITEVKTISKNGFEGMEGTLESLTFYMKAQILQKQNIVYLMMVASSDKVNISQEDAMHFFTSFKGLAYETKNEWVKFELPQKSFSVMMPALPKENKLVAMKMKRSNWNFTQFDLSDMSHQVLYIVQVRELKGGYYLTGNTQYFKEFKENFQSSVDQAGQDTIIFYKGFPSITLNGKLKNQDLRYRCRAVIKENRIYMQMAAGPSNMDTTMLDNFFSSLEFMPGHLPVWHTYKDFGFTATAPAPLENFVSADTTIKNNVIKAHVFSLDTLTGISYDVLKEKLPAFYWSHNDSSFYNEMIQKYGADSVIEQKPCVNGSLKGMAYQLFYKDMQVLKKIRFFVNGDTVYSLVAHVPPSLNKEAEKFFSGFSLDSETKPFIFSDRSEQLLSALKSTDSASFHEAKTSLKTISFTREDLPFLHRAFLQEYHAPDSNINVTDIIYNILVKINDSSTIQFISENYPSLQKRDDIRYNMLLFLANAKTAASYALLGKYFEKDIPVSNSYYYLRDALSDSLQLTRQLFPILFHHFSDSSFSSTVAMLTNTLIDSSLLTVKDIQPYFTELFMEVKRRLKNMNALEENPYDQIRMIELLQKINSKESNQYLYRYLKTSFTLFKYHSILALVKNHLPVPAEEIRKVAAERAYRQSLYTRLNNLQQASLFPLLYKTQRSLSESHLSDMIDDNLELNKMVFIGVQKQLYKGKPRLFYLYRLWLTNGENENIEQLGIAGGYALDPKNLDIADDVTGIYSDENFNEKKTLKHLKAYLSALEQNN